MAHPEDLGPEIHSAKSPETDLNIDGETYTLTWDNSLVRKFLVGEGGYDHLLHQLPNGERLFVFLDSAAGTGLREHLEENTYPYRVDPAVSDEIIELYVRKQAAGLDDEIAWELS